MKKSTIAITLGISGIFILLTVANLKLMAEYKKGHIRSALTAIPLPSFHHIKENSSNNSDRIGGFIKLIQHKDSSALLHNYYESPGVLYSVKNDTLFIERSILENGNAYDITIYFNKLESLQLSNSNITIPKCITDSISITTNKYASIRCERLSVKKISIEASENSGVTIASSDTIPYADIVLHDWASFKASSTFFKEKELKLSSVATVSFSGFSLDNFGVNKTWIRK